MWTIYDYDTHVIQFYTMPYKHVIQFYKKNSKFIESVYMLNKYFIIVRQRSKLFNINKS